MSEPIVIVWDCGATNVRAVAIDKAGKLLAQASQPNASVQQADGEPDWRVWDVTAIFEDLCRLTRQVVAKVDRDRIKALTITTWGADGTCVDATGEPTYPVISWQCPRTNDLVARIQRDIDPETIFRLTGYQLIPFNTLLRIWWLKENAPEAWDKAEKFLMVPGIFSRMLTGELSVDPTMAGTSMAFNVVTRSWDKTMLDYIGVDDSIWPAPVEPGQVIGTLLSAVAEKTDLPADLPVTAAGHDTQFALYGSGASMDQAVVSSGTWEILMVRTEAMEPTAEAFKSGIIIEQDASPGLVNPQFLMMASGALEWLKNMFWRGEGDEGIYDRMAGEARNVGPGSNGVVFLPSFVAETGPTARYRTPGTLTGLQLNTTRGEVYHAGLEGVSMQLRYALDVFSEALDFQAKGICIVGGGSKNTLWNQIRADVTGLPLTVTEHKEATVLGAAMFALVGVGEFDTIDQAQRDIPIEKSVVEPSSDSDKYQHSCERYVSLTQNLGPAYQGYAR